MLNKQHLPILQMARQLLETREHSFICHALRVAGKRLHRNFDANDVVEHVRGALNGYGTLLRWVLVDMEERLGSKSFTCGDGDLAKPYLDALLTERGNTARLAWLDKLIWDIENAQ
jgi:hypothetical protein